MTHENKFGMFIHWGIYALTELQDQAIIRYEMDRGEYEALQHQFNPVNYDPESWVLLAKNAGMKYICFTTKHHDGFCMWDTKYTDYSIMNTPYGKDVLKMLADACEKHGMLLGLYYSNPDWNHPLGYNPNSSHQWKAVDKETVDTEGYREYIKNQITELLTNYGKIDYLWFDGCGSEGHEYDHARIINAICEMQPEILTFCDPEWSPGVRWIGNEDGYASLYNPLVVSKTDFSELSKEEQTLSQAMFLPSECDCKIRDTWFYDNNEDTIKTVDELFGMYEASVGNGSNFLINIGPDNHGLLCDADASRLLELGEKIKSLYASKRNYSAPTRDGNVYTLIHNEVSCEDWKIPSKSRLVNCMSIKEDLTNGQKIESFRIYAYLPYYKHKKILVFEGRTVGHRKLCRFPAVRASKFELEITEFQGDHEIKEIEALFID